MALADSALLGTNATFLSRIQAALLNAAVAIFNEGLNVVNHQPRVVLVHAILSSPTNLSNYASMFASAVATDSTVVNLATVNGTVTLTSGNIATQQALVTDTAINNGVSAMYNAFCSGISA
jgi:hypothetical protein